ncbi:hypothetical protein PR048_006658 [Dryococelus australis]|uniref:Transposase n=1 Tax=Dryococelus australis TaxID=614101 RepID=A0ABQ9IBJ9_9NEOP|nr:hypothetical protein PR048_006658 [Dryococelus australis]
MKGKSISVDVRLFDQYCYLTAFLKEPDQSFFDDCLNVKRKTLFRYNASVERIFSMISSQWTKERNRLLPETVKSIITVVYNFKETTCENFYSYLLKNPKILNKISSSEKY